LQLSWAKQVADVAGNVWESFVKDRIAVDYSLEGMCECLVGIHTRTCPIAWAAGALDAASGQRRHHANKFGSRIILVKVCGNGPVPRFPDSGG
jgi:hypothetical protein